MIPFITKGQESSNLYREKRDEWLPGVGDEGLEENGKWLLKGTGFLFVMLKCPKIYCGAICMTVHIKRTDCILKKRKKSATGSWTLPASISWIKNVRLPWVREALMGRAHESRIPAVALLMSIRRHRSSSSGDMCRWVLGRSFLFSFLSASILATTFCLLVSTVGKKQSLLDLHKQKL